MKKPVFFITMILLTWYSCVIPLRGQVLKLDPIIPDFQVNDNTGLVGPYQGQPSIANNNNGTGVIVWVDGRAPGSNIYAQSFSSNGTIGSNFIVTEDSISVFRNYPSVSMDSNGNFIVTWEDFRNSNENIYARRIAADGTPLGNEFKVNDSTHTSYSPDVATDSDGNFVITWETMRQNGWGIYAQMYASDGSTIGDNFKVDDDTTDSPQSWPAISSHNNGNFVITWLGSLNNVFGIYAQRYASNGLPIGVNFKVNEDSIGLPHFYPDISIAGNGNFIAIWKVYNLGKMDIYGQRFSQEGVKLGGNFKVNEDSIDLSISTRIAVSTDISGNFTVVWDFAYPGTFNYDVYAQRYSSDGVTLGNNFRVNDDGSNRRQSYPAISLDGIGNFTITWEDNRVWDSDIYAQRYSNVGQPLGNNFEVNDDTLSTANQRHPSIAVNHDESFIITWHDYRNGYSDIYAQLLTGAGIPIGTNFKVNQDTARESKTYPMIANNNSGDFVIVWFYGDDSNIENDVYAQRYSGDGTPLGNNFIVNEASGAISFLQSALSVAVDSSGNFVVSWNQRPNSMNFEIYAQRYLQNGLPQGINFVVNDDSAGAAQFVPDVVMSRDGNFVITWMDLRSGLFEIYAQRYTNDGAAMGNNYIVNEDSATVHHFFPGIAMGKDGNFIISWYIVDVGSQSGNVYAQRYSANGVELGNNFRVSEDDILLYSERRKPAVSIQVNGNFMIVWERFLDNNVYAQRYASNGTPIGNNFRITTENSSIQGSPDMVLWNNRIYNAWEDNRVLSTGFDIWANVLDFDNPVGLPNYKPKQLPASFVLEPNFPNPFNPSTVIRYKLPVISDVEVVIYNIVGQKIRSLIIEKQTAGSYQVQWDGKDERGSSVSSGIYLYRLKTRSFTQTRKMVLIR